MAKTFEVTCPHCNQVFEVEAPAKAHKSRGQLAGIPLVEMTTEQLKREIINAGSVLYKATKRGADEAKLAELKARLDAAKAEKASRSPIKAEAEEAPNVEDAIYSDEM